MHMPPVVEPPQSLAVVGDHVRPTLSRSAEFRALSAERQSVLIQDMVRAGVAAARAVALRRSGYPAAVEESAPAGQTAVVAGTVTSGELVESVDFPTFVAAVIKGTFEAIVDASIRQMQAYTELLTNVAKSVDEFMYDNVIEDPDCGDSGREPEAADSARRRLAAERQQLLATMVLMGINRIVVTDGTISAAVTFELRPC
jgi:hypothetical protein